jgi:predicted nucleic acid-binding protein
MIVVDTAVWIDFFNGVASQAALKLQGLLGTRLILVGDLILCEVLQGFRDESQAAAAHSALAAFDFEPMVGRDIALMAAANYRTLRRRGITIRKTIDVLIGTFCIARGHQLLHSDRDFEQMSRHLGLSTA